MNPVDIAIIVAVAVALAAAVAVIVYRKVKHKGCCDCDCGCGKCSNDCSHCRNCMTAEEPIERKEDADDTASIE